LHGKQRFQKLFVSAVNILPKFYRTTMEKHTDPHDNFSIQVDAVSPSELFQFTKILSA
jgi:hypothetical protein